MFQKLEGGVVGPLVRFHDVGDYDGGRPTHSGVAVDVYIGEPAVLVDELEAVLEVVSDGEVLAVVSFDAHVEWDVLARVYDCCAYSLGVRVSTEVVRTARMPRSFNISTFCAPMKFPMKSPPNSGDSGRTQDTFSIRGSPWGNPAGSCGAMFAGTCCIRD